MHSKLQGVGTLESRMTGLRAAATMLCEMVMLSKDLPPPVVLSRVAVSLLPIWLYSWWDPFLSLPAKSMLVRV
jgi:hypothetical protein